MPTCEVCGNDAVSIAKYDMPAPATFIVCAEHGARALEGGAVVTTL